MNSQGSITKGALLVAGTSIGGGMLALPVLTGLSGFFPSILVYILCWIFMASTGLLLLEVCSWVRADANLVTMAEKTLGKPGKWVAWGLYLFLFYCLTLAYIVGCGDLTAELLQNKIPEWVGALIFLLIFSPLVFAGAGVVGRVNIFLMLGLGISYLAFVWMGYKHVDTALLTQYNWQAIPLAFPIAFTAFAYQGIIPTLVTYMNGDTLKARKAILIGSFIPLIVYIIWQALILGIVPASGPGGLYETLKAGENAVHPLKYFLTNPNVYIIGQFFAFFALVTSFLGVTLGLLDFLADGLNVKKTPMGKFFLCCLIFIPPLIFSFTYPGLFLMALDFAGGFGCALLLGLLPIAMVWWGRYHLNLASENRVFGGKFFLVILSSFVLFELCCQIGLLLGIF